MPQLQTLVLTDRADTPVDHTFLPRNIEQGVATVAESSGVPIGDNTVTISSRRTPSGNVKVTIKGRFPTVVTETVNGVESPKVVRTAYADLTFSFDPTSSEQERDDVVGMIADALSSDKTLINGTLVKLEGIY